MDSIDYNCKLYNYIKYGIYIIFSFFVFCACHEKTEYYQSMIIGEWESIDGNNMTAWYFDENKTCRKEPGFFEYVDLTKPTVSNPKMLHNNAIIEISAILNNTIRYYRNHSSYMIESNCLKILDPALKAWSEYDIDFISKDTLIIRNRRNKVPEYYLRKEKQNISLDYLFDQIIIYYPPTDFFLCGRYYSYYRSGQMMVYGNNGFSNNCFFASINKDDYFRLENYFKQANIHKYLSYMSKQNLKSFSLNTPYIIFVQRNRIYSFNNDFNIIEASDFKEFYRAFFKTMYYAENIFFQPSEDYFWNTPLWNFDTFHSMELYSRNMKINLNELEYYFIATLLQTAQNTDEKFYPVYQFKEKKYNEVKIQTDGRDFSSGTYLKKKTVDLGFNILHEIGINEELK